MTTATIARSGNWSVARFPSRDLRQEFLGQVDLWNRVEGLPCIRTEVLHDGLHLRYSSEDPRQENIRRLIDAFGGFIASQPAASTR